MADQGEYASGSWNPFFSPGPLQMDMHNGKAQPFLHPSNSAPSFHGMSFLPKTSSMSSLNSMSSEQNNMSNTMSRPGSVSSFHDMSFMQMPNSASPMHGNHGMGYLPRRNSASSLHSMSSEPPHNELQKISFLIPNPPGPPTLVNMFASAPPISPLPPTVFGGGNFPLSPQPMSPMFREAHNVIPKSGLLDEVSRRVLHQVEFYFSDLNVATTDHLIRYMHKDPEGYVPMSVISSFKKIRTAINSNAQLADILKHSKKLIVSNDGKRVKRVDHLNEAYMEDLQSRIVVAENLPEDHCHQTLMIIFSEVGSVNAIRTCPPSASYGVVSSMPRTEISDGLFHSNKLHSFVEYESPEMAEKAVAELNVENQTNGLKVHFLKSKVKSSPPRSVKACQFNDICGLSTEECEGDEDGEQKKQQGRGRGKGREQSQHQPFNSRTKMIGTSYSSPNLSTLSSHEHHGPKQALVPRMPDGTKGFSRGRGKMIDARAVRV